MQINFVPLSKTSIEASNSTMVIPSSRPSVGGAFVPMPVGEKNGDLIYWDPNAGDSGAWVIISAPDINEEEPKFLKFGSNLFWGDGKLPDGTNKGDLLYWDPAAGDGGAWVVLAAPSGSGLRVLTISGGNLAWTDTQDC